jgi:hypothetical protein
LLCHPSPNVRRATHHEFFESSSVANRRRPHRCVAEFTSHVACRPTTTRRKIAQLTRGQPPMASRVSPSVVNGTQWYVVNQR